jgi:hypothetical protein
MLSADEHVAIYGYQNIQDVRARPHAFAQKYLKIDLVILGKLRIED